MMLPFVANFCKFLPLKKGAPPRHIYPPPHLAPISELVTRGRNLSPSYNSHRRSLHRRRAHSDRHHRGDHGSTSPRSRPHDRLLPRITDQDASTNQTHSSGKDRSHPIYYRSNAMRSRTIPLQELQDINKSILTCTKPCIQDHQGKVMGETLVTNKIVLLRLLL